VISYQLELHPDKTRIVNETDDPNGFDFLGYTFKKGIAQASRDPDEKTIYLRAVCDRTACTVRRKGRVWKGSSLSPYRFHGWV
jgi:hypothetical protein